jgi:MFS transporter, CP family, cyanate transporter
LFSDEHLKIKPFMPDGKSVEPHQSYYRWIILALLWLLYVCHGVVNRSTSPLVTPMLRDLDMSYGQMGFVLGSWQLTYIAVAVFTGIFIDKWGIRISLFLGVVVISLSAILRYFVGGGMTLLLTVALFGIGGPMVSIGAPKTISMWFKGKERSTAVGIYVTGARLGQMVCLAATNSLIMPMTGYSWRLTFLFYGYLTFGAALIWWLFARDVGTAEASEKVSTNQVILRLVREPSVRILLAAGLLTFAITHGFTSWLPKLLETRGMTPTAAGVTSALPLLASIPCIILVPRLIPPHVRGQFVALLAFLAACAMIVVATSKLLLLGALLLFGITAPTLFPMLMLILMDLPEVESRYMGSAGGVFFCVSDIGGFLGPLAVGTLVDLSGTFLAGASFLAMAGMMIAAFLLRLKSRQFFST